MNITSLLVRFVRAFARRGGPIVVGLVAVCALIWYAGPRLGFGDTSLRLWLIAGVVGFAAVIALGRWLYMAHRGRRMHTALSQDAAGAAAEREADIQAVREKMDEAIRSLKSSDLGGRYRGTTALYALPWYMVIGPSAAGKSTLLRNSGLHFPYAETEDLSLRGVGGTRNCDWWFSDQAVLLDTAGRYTTEEHDRDEWLTFLQMLRRHRKRMPINGVVVALSVSDLLRADSKGLERHVRIVRDRINELIHELGLVFPVYLVFTKCDLIRGFEAFFEDLSEHEREQVWGACLLDRDSGEEGDAGDLFTTRMRELYTRLGELRLRKLAIQRNLRRKTELYDFPGQFLAASETLEEFVRLLFRDNPYQETPLFAGVYLTSGTQEGTPLQRMLGSLRQAFGVAEEEPAERRDEPRPYFVRNLFSGVVFQLQGIVRDNRRRVLWGRWLKGATVAASLAVIAGTFLVLAGAYTANSLLLGEGQELVAELERDVAEDTEPAEVYDRLAALFAYYQRLEAYEDDRPLVLRAGVYTASDLIEPIEQILFLALGRWFRDPAFRALEYRIENLSRDWESAGEQGRERYREDYYEALKVYLAVAFAPGRLEPELAAAQLADLWAKNIGFADVDQSYDEIRHRAPALERIVEFYLRRAEREPASRDWPLRAGLVKTARFHLSTPPDPDQLYEQLRNKGVLELGTVEVAGLLSGENRRLLEAEESIPALYTRRGWHEFVRDEIDRVINKASRGDWVLNAPLDQPAAEAVSGGDEPIVDEDLARSLRDGIRERYFEDYANRWLSFLASVRPVAYESLDDAASKLMRFARSDGPIGELMQSVARHINPRERAAPQALAIAPGSGEMLSDVAAIPELATSFADLRRFANAADNKTVSDLINQYLLVLAELKNDVERLTASVDLARDAERYAADILAGGGSDSQLYRSWVATSSLLNGTEVRTQDAVAGLLRDPISGLWRQLLALARAQIQSEWQASVVSVYRGQLRGKFPFNASGPDAALDDVSEFFRPQNGVIWRFVHGSLSPYLVQTRNGWRPRQWLDSGVGFSRSFLRSIDDAGRITRSLFRQGGDRPGMTFYVYPLPASGLSEISLESNGQSYRYRNGPQEWRRFSWPGDMRRIGARIGGVISRGAAAVELTASGQWGLFHLLQHAELSSEGGTVYKAQWRIDAGVREAIPVRFMIRADRQNSVFQGSLMVDFGLPSALFAGLPQGSATVAGGQ